MSETPWDCIQCFYENEASAVACTHCNAPRPYVSSDPPLRFCKGCGVAFKYSHQGPDIHDNGSDPGSCRDLWERKALMKVEQAARAYIDMVHLQRQTPEPRYMLYVEATMKAMADCLDEVERARNA